jgi:hypothetical protein
MRGQALKTPSGRWWRGHHNPSFAIIRDQKGNVAALEAPSAFTTDCFDVIIAAQ